MRSPSIVLIAALLGCSTQHRPEVDRHTGRPSRADGSVDPPSPASEAENQEAAKCQRLEAAARTDFEDALQDLEIDQCRTTADCTPHATYYATLAFVSDTNGCWPGCGIIAGTKQYVDAIKAVANDSCREFRTAHCAVQPSSCPISSVTPAWMCVDGACMTE